jgi:hypothetical protein
MKNQQNNFLITLFSIVAITCQRKKSCYHLWASCFDNCNVYSDKILWVPNHMDILHYNNSNIIIVSTKSYHDVAYICYK